MVAIINGTRVAPPRPDIKISNIDPNARLEVINDAKLVTEQEKSEPTSQKKIANFRPENLREFSNRKRLEQVRFKQRKGDIKEVILRVKNAINKAKRQNLKNSRFAKELGKGSVFDTLA